MDSEFIVSHYLFNKSKGYFVFLQWIPHGAVVRESDPFVLKESNLKDSNKLY